MGILSTRLLIILNEEETDSTYYHIALTMLEHMDELEDLSITQLAALCAVSKSTLSKFIRFIGYEDYSEFRYDLPNRYVHEAYSGNYVNNVMGYMDEHGPEAMIGAVEEDIRALYETLDWDTVDRLVEDIDSHSRIGVFGMMFSESAALDFQTKLAHNHKFVVTNLSGIKQERFIRQAGSDTLLILFSNSGEYLDHYGNLDGFHGPGLFDSTEAKVVLITANEAMREDPRVAYCLTYPRTHEVCTHRVIYSILTDLITWRYHTRLVSKNRNS